MRGRVTEQPNLQETTILFTNHLCYCEPFERPVSLVWEKGAMGRRKQWSQPRGSVVRRYTEPVQPGKIRTVQPSLFLGRIVTNRARNRMSELIKYAHVGYPKCMSTWFQKNYFPCVDALYHCGRGGVGGDWLVDDAFRRIVWLDLIRTPSELVDLAACRSHFLSHCERAKDLGKTAIGISQENLTLTRPVNQDMETIAERLRAVCGKECRIILVVREQFSLLRSLYGSWVSEGGLYCSFEEFLFHVFFERDFSAYCTLLYDRVYSRFCRHFDPSNIMVVPFEAFRASPGRFVKAIDSFLEVESRELQFSERVNPSPTPDEIAALRVFNKAKRFNLGGAMLERAFGHAVTDIVYDKRARSFMPESVANTLYRSRQFAMQALHNRKGIIQAVREAGLTPEPEDLSIPQRYVEAFGSALAESNERLMESANVDISCFYATNQGTDKG